LVGFVDTVLRVVQRIFKCGDMQHFGLALKSKVEQFHILHTLLHHSIKELKKFLQTVPLFGRAHTCTELLNA